MTASDTPQSNAFFARHPGACFLFVAFVTLLTMGRIAGHEFVSWDDRSLLADNPKFNPPTWHSVLGFALPHNADGNIYIPATDFFWGILSAIGRTDAPDANGSALNPWIFHCASLGLHLASIATVFAILRQLIDDWPALIGTLVFAIHPVQVETVAWASETKDLLAGLFGFICIYHFMRFRRTDMRWNFIAAMAAAAVAMLSKPSAVAIPIELLVIDVLLLKTNLGRSILQLLWSFLVAIPIFLIAHRVQPVLWPTGLSIIARPLIALDTIAFYITKIVAPVHLVFDYGRTPSFALANGWRPLWIVPILLCIFLFWKRHRYPDLLAGFLIFVAGILPVLGLVPFMAQDYSTVSDHYLYPSMLGVAMIAASLFEAGTSYLGGASFRCVVLVLAIALAVRSFAAAGIWSDSSSLFSHALSINPLSANAHAGMAYTLAQSGDTQGAIEHFLVADKLNSHNGMVIMGLANLLLKVGDLDGAAVQYERLMQIYQMQPNFDPKLAAAGETVVAARLIHLGNSSGAIAALKQAAQWDPANPQIAPLLARARQAATLK